MPHGLCPQKGDPSDFVIVHGSEGLAQAVLNPGYDRTTIRRGIVVARRRTNKWVAHAEPPAIPLVFPWYRHVRWMYMLCPPLFVYKLLVGQAFYRNPRVHKPERLDELRWEEAATTKRVSAS